MQELCLLFVEGTSTKVGAATFYRCACLLPVLYAPCTFFLQELLLYFTVSVVEQYIQVYKCPSLAHIELAQPGFP